MSKFLGIVLVLGIAAGAIYYLYPDLLSEHPTERAAKAAVEKQVAAQSKAIGIDLFQKADGQERTDTEGVRRYALDYKCVAKFKKDTMWSFIGGRFATADPLPEGASRKERKAAEGLLAGKQLGKSGDTVALKGTVEFEHKESGWVATSTSMTLDR